MTVQAWRVAGRGARGAGVVALLSQRARYHLSYRLLVRFQQVADKSGAAHDRRWRGLAAGWAAADVVTGLVLRRRRGLLLAPRLAMDAADTAMWSVAPYPSTYWDWAALPAVPFALEAGLERGARGLVVPATNYLAARAARRRTGHTTALTPFVRQLIGVGAGMMFTVVDRAVRDDALRQEQRRRDAECNRASLAGQNSVAVGTANALDRLRRVAVLLGDHRPDSSIRELCEAWRSSLADRTRAEAAYLRDTLLRYEQRRRNVPDLGSHIRFDIPDDTGTLVLSADQAAALEEILDGLPLRGVTHVHVDGRMRHRPPGAALTLTLGRVRVTVPEDPRRPPRAPDVGPIVLAPNTAWFLRTTAASAEAVPRWAAAGPIAASLAGAGWADRRLRQRGPAARAEVLALALAIGAVHVVVATVTMRRPYREFGGQNFPAYAALAGPGVIGSYYLDTLSPKARAGLFGGLAAIAGLAALTARRPIEWGQYAVNLSWGLGAVIPGLNLEAAFRAAIAPELRRMQVETERSVRRGFDDGRRFVLDLAGAAARDARALLDERRYTMSSDLIGEIEEAMEEVDRCLTELVSSS